MIIGAIEVNSSYTLNNTLFVGDVNIQTVSIDIVSGLSQIVIQQNLNVLDSVIEAKDSSIYISGTFL